MAEAVSAVPVTVQRALSLAARRHARKVAIRYRDRCLTYAELDARADRIAALLQTRGVRLRDRVAVMLPNGPDYVALAWACAKAGFCMVPLNYRFTGAEIASQVQDCGASALLYDVSFAGQVASARLPQTVRGVVHDDGFDAALEEMPRATDWPTVREDDLFYLGYTSGTTGKPKGAMVSQRNRALAYHYWALEFGITDADVALHCGPFHHTAPFTFTLTQLFMGGEVIILDSFDGDRAAHAIRTQGVTWSFMVPFMLERLLETDLDAAGASRLRMLVSGASPLSTRTKEQVLQRFPAVGLHEFYGATEAGVVTNLRPADQASKSRCVGQPVADIEIEIREEGSCMPAGCGVVGDIWMRGPTLFAGYFGAPEQTAQVRDGQWCTLGDIGRMDAEGFLYLVDRRKDVIKSGGVNIYPIEIEEVILSEPAVRECAVVGMPDARWGEMVCAFLVLRPDAGTRDSDHDVIERVRALCRESLAGFKQPREIRCIDTLPRNANGKVLKRELRLDGTPPTQPAAARALP
ncbi:MAG: class I adenylate-forming enzyme family protein [Ramlibacter sp.]